MATEDTFDVIVIGAGPAGEVAAGRAVHNGLSAAVVERRWAGGECSFYGCIPSKALLWPMELSAAVSRMPGLSLRTPIAAAAVFARRDAFVWGYHDDSQVRWVKGLPAGFYRGQGRLAGPLLVDVVAPAGEVRRLEARHAVVLATGSDPVVPDVPGLLEAHPWTNREATSVKEAPRRLVVIGGGAVACEMSQALHFLGSEQVTMLVRGERLLPRNEPFAGELLASAFEESGISVRTGRRAVQVGRRRRGGAVTVRVDDGSRVQADEILVAAGRKPNVTGIGLETVGLDTSQPVRVDSTMRATGVEGGWLYAVGDVNGRNLLTHMGKYQARVCADAIAARAKTGEEPGRTDIADDLGAPQALFTDPQVIAVGRTEAEAREEGFDVRAVESDFGGVAGASLQANGYTGRAKIVVDEDRHVLLGVTFVGPGVVDHLHAATIAVTAEVPLERLWHAVPAFPTTSEIWLRLQEAYGL